jgi:hypothetical protein
MYLFIYLFEFKALQLKKTSQIHVFVNYKKIMKFHRELRVFLKT